MPLLDHFHAPLVDSYPWQSFHTIWAVAIAGRLNATLPRRYVATVQTHLGRRVEADVAEFELPLAPEDEPRNGTGGGVAVQTWAPPAVTSVLPAVFPDDIQVKVIDQMDSMRLVAVIELISPGNKDRPEARRAFGAKCAAYLQRGVGLVAVDTVTSRRFNLHNDFVRVTGLPEQFAMPDDVWLYATAYRPARRHDINEIDFWAVPLAVGGALPLLPLALKGTRAVPFDLEATYTGAREAARL